MTQTIEGATVKADLKSAKRLAVIEAANPLGLSAPLGRSRKQEALWLKIHREDAWRAQGRVCAYCWTPIAKDDVTADHVTPRVAGGKTTAENIKGCCNDCNVAKAHWPEARFKKALRNPRSVDTSRLPFTAQMRLLRAHMRFVIWRRTKRAEKRIRQAVGLK